MSFLNSFLWWAEVSLSMLALIVMARIPLSGAPVESTLLLAIFLELSSLHTRMRRDCSPQARP